MPESRSTIYPKLVIKNNQKPNRWLNIPFLGILFRVIITIPVSIIGFFYGIYWLILWLIIPFVILFTGTYPDSFYNFFLGFAKFTIKVYLYFYGLTDVYPGFGLDDKGIFELHVDKPKKPSRLFAFPLLGFVIRLILLIPYIIYIYVLTYGSQWAVFFSWFAVLFNGKYPESLYEFNRDFIRVAIAESLYVAYIYDKYPSFYISMKHKGIKILLIVLGALTLLGRSALGFSEPRDQYNNHYNNYNYQKMPEENPGS